MHSFEPRKGFVSSRPAHTWEEGLLCGNGTIGTNAFCRPYDETVIFTHEKLFLPCGQPTLPALMGPRLDEIRELIDQGRFADASQLAFDISGQPSFLLPDPFVPAFDLTIVTQGTEVQDYRRSVDFTTGEAVVQWISPLGQFQRRLFVSRTHGVAVMELAGPPGELTCSLSLGHRRPGNGLDDEKIKRSNGRFDSHVADLTSSADDEGLQITYRFTRTYPESIKHLAGAGRVVATGGTVDTEGNTITVSNADRILLVIALDVSYDDQNNGLNALRSRLNTVSLEYDDLLAAHTKVHGDLFNRVLLDLGGGADHSRPIEELLDEAATQSLNPALVEKVFDAGRYNIISCTGEWPPALQGLWGGTYVPDWSGDYTHNGNVPSAIAGMLMGHTPELMMSYIRYLEYLVPGLALNAERMFNARGIVLPSRSSTHGYNNALAPSFAGGFWMAGAAWAAHFFYDYWLYTADRDFLANHALPFMEKAAVFFEDYLYEDDSGTYVFSPTQSPENTPANSDSQASFNATMTVAAVKELLQNLIAGSEELGTNVDRIPTWQKMLTKMPDYMINDSGLIKEWLTPVLENNDRHRHASHLYPLYDGLPDAIASSPELMEAFKQTIRDKLDRHWRENSTGFMSFGVVQLGQASTSLGDGEMAYDCLVHLVNRYWLNNLASMHNHKSLLNMDISGGLPAVIMKMLVSSAPGVIGLLPALPDAWPTGSVEGILCRGAITVQRLAWTPGTIDATLVSLRDQTITVTLPAPVTHITINDKQQPVSTAEAISVCLTENQPVTLAVSR